MVGFEEKQLCTLLGKREIFNARSLILTGDASGLAAAQMMHPLFERQCGIFMGCRVMTPLDLAVYATASSLGTGEPDSPWIIALCADGSDRYLAQAMENAAALGAFTVLVTCRSAPEIPASRVLTVRPENEPLLSLCAGAAGIACRIADVKRCCPPLAFSRWKTAWQGYARQVNAALSRQEEVLEKFAANWLMCDTFEAVGDGGCIGAARCAAWTILEKRGIPASVYNGEDWCHIPFFRGAPETVGTLFFCQTASGVEGREQESIEMAEKAGRNVTLITDMARSPEGRTLRLPVPPDGFPWLFAPFAASAARVAAERMGGDTNGL